MGEMRNLYNILGGKPEGKRPLGRRRNRWEDIMMYWMHLAQYRDRRWDLVDTVMNHWVP
jgi:hypothetical protein